MRSAVGQAQNTYGQDQTNATSYGGAAGQISGTLTPFLTQRLMNPQGYSQGDMGAMLANAFGSSGGAASGITGQANLEAGRNRNDAGFSTALDAAARSRTQADASTSEGIASNNANLKQDQSNNAAKMLQGLYGTDVGAQSDAMNNENQATQESIAGNQTGWLQNMNAIIQTLSGGAQGAAAAKKAFA